MALLDKKEKDTLATLYGLYTATKGSDREQIAMMEALGDRYDDSRQLLEFGVDEIINLVPQAIELKEKDKQTTDRYKNIAKTFAANYKANYGPYQGTTGTLEDAALQFIIENDPDLSNVPNMEKLFQTKQINTIGQNQVSTKLTKPLSATTVSRAPITTEITEGIRKPFMMPTERDIIKEATAREELIVTEPDPNNPGKTRTRPMTEQEITSNLEFLINRGTPNLIPQTNYRYSFSEQKKAISLLDTAGVKRAKDSAGTDIARAFGESYDPDFGGVSTYQKQNLKGIVDGAFFYANNYLSVTPEARGPKGEEIISSHRVYARDAGILNSVLDHYNEASQFVTFGERKGRVKDSALFAINTPQINRIETYIVGFKNNLDKGNKDAINILNKGLVSTLTNPKTGRYYEDYAEFTRDATFNEQVNLVAKVNALNNKFSNVQPQGTSGNIQQEGERRYTASLMYGTNAQNSEIGAYYDPSDGNYYETQTGGTPIKNIIRY